MGPVAEEPAGVRADSPTVLAILRLDAIDSTLYRSTLVFADPFPLYGGQVAAQALLAAGRTVDRDRLPHSLHVAMRPGVGAQRPHQVIDLPRRDAVQVGLHDHREQGLVDPP